MSKVTTQPDAARPGGEDTERRLVQLEAENRRLRKDLNEVMRTTGHWVQALAEFTGCPVPRGISHPAPAVEERVGALESEVSELLALVRERSQAQS